MFRALIALLLLLTGSVPVLAQGVVTNSTAKPSGANTALTLGALTAQQGVLLDAFRVAGDADDTAALTRAVTAQVPILCGPKTYTVNNFSSASATNFILLGVPGCVIQRTSASGSNFITINTTNVYIDGVTFDSNKAAVTANQWGVLLPSGGQSITIKNSVFKNNSGSLGSCLTLKSTGPAAGGSFVLDNIEVTGCTWNPVYMASVSNGSLINSYVHDNPHDGVRIQAWTTASSTNYSADILVQNNRFVANDGSGITVCAFAPPYPAFGTPAAKRVKILSNNFLDNSGYQIQSCGVDYVDIIGNTIGQSDPAVDVFGGIESNSRYAVIADNTVEVTDGNFGIDAGNSATTTIMGNNVKITTGTGINIGGSTNSQVVGNLVTASTSGAIAILVYDVESDGSGSAMPQHCSALTIANNRLVLASGVIGIQLADNACGTSGTTGAVIRHNDMTGGSASQDIVYKGSASSVNIFGNSHNGETYQLLDPNGSGDIVFENVYFGGNIRGLSSTSDIRSIASSYVNAYGGGDSILYVVPSAGGSGYTAATTLAASGGCTWAGWPLINNGVIIGVRTTAHGTGCSASTVSATDGGGGTGATFTATKTPAHPARSTIYYNSNAGNLLKLSGGYASISGPLSAIQLAANNGVSLIASVSGTVWVGPVQPPVSYAVGSLPTCNSTRSGLQVTVTGSTTSMWFARCNGTDWLWPDGTTVSG